MKNQGQRREGDKDNQPVGTTRSYPSLVENASFDPVTGEHTADTILEPQDTGNIF
jgi:hypothetical protein